MIQDILPEHFKNQYETKEPDAGSRVLLFAEDGIYIKANADLPETGEAQGFREPLGFREPSGFPSYRDILALYGEKELPASALVYLFAIDEETYFFVTEQEIVQELVRAANTVQSAEGVGLRSVPMFRMRAMYPKRQVFAAATAWHLFRWYTGNRFCGRCGGATRHSGTLRMLECPACGNQIFPKIAPAVIIGVTDGGRILMTKYANRAYKRYALIAGFTEIGETAEETVRREVMEEVGLRVKHIRYYKSQPWGFDSNLLLGYFCELDGPGEIALDEEELAVAEWVDWREIPDDEEGLSLTQEMMTVFRESCRANSSFFMENT